MYPKRADIRHYHAFFGAFPLVLHSMIELRFRLLECRRQHFGLAKTLRLALPPDCSGTSPGVAEIRCEPPQIQLISVGKDIDCSDRGV